MDIFELVSLLRRQWIPTLVIVLATAIAGGTLAWYTPPTAHSTQLFSVSITSTPTTNAFDLTKVADDFADTIAGWTRAPDFGARVSTLAGIPVSVGGSTQATQNLIMQGSFGIHDDVTSIMNAVERTLAEHVTRYNERSSYQFAVVEYGRSHAVRHQSVPLATAAGALGGGLLAIVVALLASYARQRIASVRMAEQIAGSAVVVAQKAHGDRGAFVRRAAKSVDLVIGIDCDPKRCGISGSVLRLPHDAEKVDPRKKALLLVVLDTSTSETLREARRILPDASLAILERAH